MNKEATIPRQEPDRPEYDAAQTASYIADMSGSLAVMARRLGLDLLGYILDMAQEEARNSARLHERGGGAP